MSPATLVVTSEVLVFCRYRIGHGRIVKRIVVMEDGGEVNMTVGIIFSRCDVG